MPAFRLVFLVAIVVGVLVAIAASTSQQGALRTETTTTIATPPARQPSRTINAELPRKRPIEARVGDTINLSLTLDQGDTVALDAFGFEEGIASGVPTIVRFVVTQAGTFELVARQANKPLVEIVSRQPELLKPATPKDGAPKTTPTPAPAPKDAAPATNPATAVPAGYRPASAAASAAS